MKMKRITQNYRKANRMTAKQQDMPDVIWAYETENNGRGMWYDEDVTGPHTKPGTVAHYVRAALSTPVIDRESLKKQEPPFGKDDSYSCGEVKGYNDAIDHIFNAYELRARR